ncbi:MAG: PrsW family glutamic-type intramembrane protease [bacterium]
MRIVANIVVSLGPVFAFLVVLMLLDTFKLIRLRAVILTIGIGCGAALVCYLINRTVLGRGWMEVAAYSRYIAPLIEESAKAACVVYFIRGRKVGFIVDAAILGFAVGAGFSFIENIYYLGALESANIGVWIIRGFGTAVMHGGTTSILAMISMVLAERCGTERFHVFLPGLAAAIGIHIFFNQFLLPPMVNTMVQLLGLPLLMAVAFKRSESSLRDWLEVGLDTDVSLLEDITTGRISGTRVGKYLLTLKGRFPGEIVADMLCMLRVHLELAIRAKGILMMSEAGFRPPPDPEIAARFEELKYLEKSLGKTGMLAIAPVLHNSSRDLWQIHMLKSS